MRMGFTEMEKKEEEASNKPKNNKPTNVLSRIIKYTTLQHAKTTTTKQNKNHTFLEDDAQVERGLRVAVLGGQLVVLDAGLDFLLDSNPVLILQAC
jgi:hypothetical protein